MLELEQTKLWQSFAQKANDEQRQMVRSLVGKAATRLDLVRDTFPTYTLHNHLHALNVVRLMDALLGANVDSITPLEGAILILSAFLHDIGMVFTEEERQDLESEQQFERFLKQHPEAFVILKESGEVTAHLAEWYCRWVHPVRVHRYLASLDEKEISWGHISIERHLGVVCESHGMDAASLRNLDELGSDFLGKADLLFCAIILRLADILDFDHSRSPDEVYKYLGLSKRETARKSMSDVEWRKHLCSGGFIFPPADARNPRYALKVIAGPDHPAVEHDIREFLDIIENEMKQCASLLRYSAEKWRTHLLPQSINREDIISKGYKYGEYRFTLEQDQILNLLMGENLYADPYVFIRELVQNAIDATRHRIFYEYSRGNTQYRPEPIKLSTWNDKDGYQWVRVDDSGMGMNEDLIINYLLKVGRSYYRSAQFKAEILRYEGPKKFDFMPISRFGIGMLSCFIVGDLAELSTRRVTLNPYEAYGLRLSMSGLRSFYTLNVEKLGHRSSSMPNRLNEREAYRKNDAFGTSVAVRLDPRRDHSKFNLSESLNGYVAYPPIPVECEGAEVGGNYQRIIQTPWTQPLEMVLSEDEMQSIERTLNCKFSEPIKVRLLPLNLTKHSPTANLMGQGLIGYLAIPEPENAKFQEAQDHESRMATLSLVNDNKTLRAEFEYEHIVKLSELKVKRERQELEYRELEVSADRISRSLESLPSDDSVARLLYYALRELRDARRSGTREWTQFERKVADSWDSNHPLFRRAKALKHQLANVNWLDRDVISRQVERTAWELERQSGQDYAQLFYDTMRQLETAKAYFSRSWMAFEMEAAAAGDLHDALFERARALQDQMVRSDLQDEEYLWEQVGSTARVMDRAVGGRLGQIFTEAMGVLLDVLRAGKPWMQFEQKVADSGDPKSAVFERARALHGQLAGIGLLDGESVWEQVRSTARDMDAQVDGSFGQLFSDAMSGLLELRRARRYSAEFNFVSASLKGVSSEMDALLQEAENTLAMWHQRAANWVDLEDEWGEAKRKLTLDCSRIFDGLEPESKAHCLDMLFGHHHWLSHNGIFVPTRKKNTDTAYQKYDEIKLNSPIKAGWSKYTVALQDSLRPDVTLSRDELRALPWNIYSALTLALSRTLQVYNHDGRMDYNLDIFSILFGQEDFLLDTILNDPNIADGAWEFEPIIRTDRGNRSIKQIQQAILAGQEVELMQIMQVHGIIHSKATFIPCCQAVLIQMGLNIEFLSEQGKFIVKGPGSGIKEGQKLFPPLFFVPYENTALLRMGDNPLNLKHPFSQWLIENAYHLMENYPGIFDSIRRNISRIGEYGYRAGKWGYFTTGDMIASVNRALERLRQIDGQSRPSEKLTLQASDFS